MGIVPWAFSILKAATAAILLAGAGTGCAAPVDVILDGAAGRRRDTTAATAQTQADALARSGPRAYIRQGGRPPMTRDSAPAETPHRVAEDVARVEAFVQRHYSLRGTWSLHRHALGWDLLRAPANVLLAPWALALRLAALAASGLGRPSLARRLAGRPLAFRSDVGRAVEAALLTEVIAPRADTAPSEAQRRIVADHVALRGAIAEIATTLAVIALGVTVFRALTPGVLSLAPVMTDHMAQARDIAAFPLGDRLGAAWYGLFPAARPLWQTAAVGMALVLAFSLLTTFAGLLADPVQSRLGIHRRRLRRLLARLDRADADARPGVEREVLLARLGDIADAGAALARFLRP